jgi:hypothetical protein
VLDSKTGKFVGMLTDFDILKAKNWELMQEMPEPSRLSPMSLLRFGSSTATPAAEASKIEAQELEVRKRLHSVTLLYKVLVIMTKRLIAATELLLVFPAVLFMGSLFVRQMQPQRYQPAHAAEQIVEWYAARPHVGLWILLILMPFTVLVSGAGALLHNWSRDVALRQATKDALRVIRLHAATLFVAISTLTAGGILAVVALHVLTD